MSRCLKESNLDTPPDTYLYSLAISSDTSTAATIASDDSLRLFHPDLEPKRHIPNSHTGITTLISGTQNTFHTAGRDGQIHTYSIDGKPLLTIHDPSHTPISALAVHGYHLAAGTESAKEGLSDDVTVALYDLRKPSSPLVQYRDSHTDTITRLQFHPTQSNILLSGSTDGLVSLFNIREADEDDALVHVLNPRSAVHCAGFLSENEVFVVSTDEQFSVYTLPQRDAEDESEVVPPPWVFGDVRNALECMYVVDVRVDYGVEGGPPVMVYGHNERRKLGMVGLVRDGKRGGWSFGERVDLVGAHGEEVVRDVVIRGQRAWTCGEDGKVKLWKLA